MDVSREDLCNISDPRFNFKGFKPQDTDITKAFESILNTNLSRYDGSIIGILDGVFFIPEYTSNNKRYYSTEFWNKVLAKDSVQERLRAGKMIGIFEHPYATKMETKEGLPTLRHPMYGGLVTKDLKIVPNTGLTNPKYKNVGYGKAYVLNTPMGDLISLYFNAKDESGAPLFDVSISSRGYAGDGPKVNGVEQMNPITYYLDAFDVTMYPGVSDTKVRMRPVHESTLTSYEELDYLADKYLNKISEKCESWYKLRSDMVKELGLKSKIFR